jgi:YVTN family beta-propeller protein
MNRREFLVTGVACAPVLACPRLPVLAAREPVALVTADLEAHVAVVSLGGRRVVRRVRTIEGPRSIQSAGRVAIVGHSAAGAVSLLEGRPPRVRRVLRGFSEPRYSVFHPDGRSAYVTDSGSGELAVIDLERGRVTRRVEVGALARHVTIDPAGRSLWISLGSSASAISVVGIGDPARPRLLRRVRPPFLVHDVGFSPSGRRVWVTAGRVPTLAIYDADGRGPLRRLGADAAPQHVTFAGGRAYVASGEGRSVHVHSLIDGRRLRAVRVPIGSYNVQLGAGRILTPSLNMGTLTILDHRGRVLASPRVAQAAHDACVVT